jgi:hypothetical protein
MSLDLRLARLERGVGLTGPGCDPCRSWPAVAIVDDVTGDGWQDAWQRHGGHCPACGRRPVLTQEYRPAPARP